MANPWDSDPIVSPAPSGPVYGAPPKADAPNPGVGYRMGGDGTAHYIPGGSADPHANGDSLTPEALDAETTNWILTGKMSPMGMGNGPLRVQIQNNRPVVMHKFGISDSQLPAIQQQFSADAKAYSQRTQQLSFMKQAVDAAKQHVEQITGYLQNLPAQGNLTPLNAVSLGLQRANSGETVTNLDSTIPLLQAEVAKVMTANPTGSGQLTDEARREFSILNSSRSPHARIQAMQAIMEMVNRKIIGTQAETDRLNQHLNGGLASYAVGGSPQGPQPPQGGQAPVGTPQTPPMGPSSNGFNETPDKQSAAFWENAARQGMSYTAALGEWRKSLVGRDLQGTEPPPPKAYVQARDYMRQHPNQEFHFNAITRTPVSPTEQAISQAAASPAGTFGLEAANGLTAGVPMAMAGDQGQYAQSMMQSRNPNAAAAGDIVGSTVGMIGGESALGRAGMKAGLGRELLANSGFGAVRGGADNPDNPVGGAALGALAAGAGTVGGNALIRGGSAVLRGVTNKDVNALAQNGVPMTVGQVAGGKTKAFEDKIMSAIGGGSIVARRAEGVRAWNSATFNHALQPIKGNVGSATGEEAMTKAHEAVTQAFSDALKGKSASPDGEFIMQSRGPLERLANNKRVGPEIVDAIEQTTSGLFDESTGALSGEHMQSFLQGLRQIREGYKNDPLYQTLIKPSIKGIENAVEGMFKRQAPEVMPKYNAAKAAYRRLSTLADAVNRGKNTEGVFSPGQLGMADRANAKKYDGAISAASGKSPFFDLQRSAQNVLPSQVPNSGTVDRYAAVKMAGGLGTLATGGAGIGYAGGDTKMGVAGGIGLAGLLAIAYSRGGQARLANLLISRSPKARAAAERLLRLAPAANATGAALAQPNQ